MPLVSMQDIYNEQQEIKKMLRSILDDKIDSSISELSLDRTRRLLKMSAENVILLVKRGKLKARVYKDKKRKTRYKFRAADVRQFQEENKYNHLSLHAGAVESSEDIAKRIFKTEGR